MPHATPSAPFLYFALQLQLKEPSATCAVMPATSQRFWDSQSASPDRISPITCRQRRTHGGTAPQRQPCASLVRGATEQALPYSMSSAGSLARPGTRCNRAAQHTLRARRVCSVASIAEWGRSRRTAPGLQRAAPMGALNRIGHAVQTSRRMMQLTHIERREGPGSAMTPGCTAWQVPSALPAWQAGRQAGFPRQPPAAAASELTLTRAAEGSFCTASHQASSLGLPLNTLLHPKCLGKISAECECECAGVCVMCDV